MAGCFPFPAEQMEETMSLLTESMTPCVLLDKKTTPDGYGGVITTWTDGAEIQAAIVLDNSIQALQAMQQGVTGVYTVTTEKTVVLRFNDVFRRISDGKVFRVASNGDDKATPASAGLNMRQVRAEEYNFHG